MGKFCVMKTCKHANNITSNIKRHKFPKPAKLKSQWLQFVAEGNRVDEFTLQAPDDIILCERHFDPSCYTRGKLKNNAIPTIVDKFTAETAFKLNLIPSPKSELLVNVNKFSKSIIKRARTPEPSESIEPNSTTTPIEEVDEEFIPEKIFSSGMLELMLIDLGEEEEDTASVDSDISRRSTDQDETNLGKSEDSDTYVPSPCFSVITNPDASPSSSRSASPGPSSTFVHSPVVSRLRRRTNTNGDAKVDKRESSSTQLRISKPGPFKRSTPVNTNTRLGSLQSSIDSGQKFRTRYSLQPVVDKENSCSTPVKRFKCQPAKATPQPTKATPQPAKATPQPGKSPLTKAITTTELPVGRLRIRSSKTVEDDKNDRPWTPENSSLENRKNGESISSVKSASSLMSRLRARIRSQSKTDKIDLLSTPQQKKSERRQKNSPSLTSELTTTRLRSRSSIKPIDDQVEKVETSSTPLNRQKIVPSAKSKPEEKRLSSDNQVTPTENFPLPSESHVPLANGGAIQPEEEVSTPRKNVNLLRFNFVLPQGLVISNKNCVPTPGGTTPKLCNCSAEEHNKIAGIARTPKLAETVFKQRSEELTSLRREFRNIQEKYDGAMTKIKTLTTVVEYLREKRRQRSQQALAFDCCGNCEKFLN